MEREIVYVKKKILVGIQAHTSYKNEANTKTSKILPLIQQWYKEDITNNIPNCAEPWCGYIQYCEFSDGLKGDLTFFMGKEVTHLPELFPPFVSQVTEEGYYAKFKTERGATPHIIVAGWNKIAKMSDEELGGKRLFTTDFEYYEDERTRDTQDMDADLFVHIEPFEIPSSN